ncbi:hypothetical protein ACWJJH_03800 [Endozoicomonadaceae bacterium StTr2]
MNSNNYKSTKNDDVLSEFYHEWGADIEDLAGQWENNNPKTGQISRIEVKLDESGLKIRCFGLLDQQEQDWGELQCETFSSNVSSSVVEGFVGNYDFGFMETQVVANVKYGVMVIQSYNKFKDGSNRNAYICREFFYKTDTKLMQYGQGIDASYYLGNWNNTYNKARAIGSVRFHQQPDGLYISLTGSDTGFQPGDWGSAPVKLHSYSPDSNDLVACQARLDMENTEAVLAMNENKGLLIIAGYFSFKDNSQSSFFVREFFYKTDSEGNL